MKIFVSGQINDLHNVRTVQQAFIKSGHTITHDWTSNETGAKMLETPQDKLRNREEASNRASKDIRGVINCDAYVICTDNADCGKGMYVELGAALALAKTKGSPQIFLVGKMNHMSVFYFHPLVRRVDTIESVIKELANRNSKP
jgi:nucleoside 2-deoxyribosyltransferase-like protein